MWKRRTVKEKLVFDKNLGSAAGELGPDLSQSCVLQNGEFDAYVQTALTNKRPKTVPFAMVQICGKLDSANKPESQNRNNPSSRSAGYKRSCSVINPAGPISAIR
jgi:hypothetical protein